jgi:hypothetical protein
MLSKSRKYLQQLPKEQRIALAAQVGTSPAYLYQLGAGIRNPSRRLALKLEQASERKIKANEFDDLLLDKVK